MNKVSLFLTALLSLSLVVIIAPNIFAMNHGKILRNIMLWVAIFLVLGLIYQNFGPGSPHPLFNAPSGTVMRQQMPAPTSTTTPNMAPDTTGSY